jgi:hypothetical protein
MGKFDRFENFHIVARRQPRTHEAAGNESDD